MEVIYCICLYVPFLNPFPLTVIHAIGAVVDVVSKSLAVPLPNFLFRVAALESILFQPLSHQEDSCAVLSFIHPQQYVIHPY